MNTQLFDRIVKRYTDERRELSPTELLEAGLRLAIAKGRRIEDDPDLEQQTTSVPECIFCGEEWRHHAKPEACLSAALFQIERLEDLVYALAARPNGWLYRELQFYRDACADMAKRLCEPLPVPPERPHVSRGVAAPKPTNLSLFAA